MMAQADSGSLDRNSLSSYRLALKRLDRRVIAT